VKPCNVLITGGAGFIGSHIAELCLEKGHYTVILDNLSSGNVENVSKQAIFYKEDIRTRLLPDILVRENIDIVFHQAAQIDVQTSIKNPQADAAINIMGTINLLEACQRAGVKKVVYASSAALYGNPLYLPIDEKHLLQPLSGYGVSKQVPEQYLYLYSEIYGLDFTILRYANVYGPRQVVSGEVGVVAIFINALLAGKTPQIFGDGEQTRDFISLLRMLPGPIWLLLTEGVRKY
jgi:UDP-glucose 4-epimerase